MPKKKLSDDLELEIDNGGVMTMKELRTFIKGQKLSPSDLFTVYDILEDELMKEAVKEQTNFELAYRDELSRREVEEMSKEDKEYEEELNNVDLLPEGDAVPSSGQREEKKPAEKKPDEEKKPPEDKEGDLLPPGEKESSESTEDDQGNEGPLLPG